jgi:hypothetical protein
MLALLRVHFLFCFLYRPLGRFVWGASGPLAVKAKPFGRKAAGRVVASLRSAPARTSPAALSGL